MKIIPLLFIILLASCSSQNDCVKSTMSNNRFVYLDENGIIPNNYFTLSDSTYEEYADDTLYAKGSVVWNSCDKYSLIVKEARYNTDEWVNPNDTLNVEILRYDGDTVLCVVRVFNTSTATKLLKVKKPQ